MDRLLWVSSAGGWKWPSRGWKPQAYTYLIQVREGDTDLSQFGKVNTDPSRPGKVNNELRQCGKIKKKHQYQQVVSVPFFIKSPKITFIGSKHLARYNYNMFYDGR